MTSRSSLALALLLSALVPRTAEAGPWSKAPGSFYAKLGQTVFYSGSFVDVSGQVVEGVSNLSFTTSLYGEVGIWRGLQLAAALPVTHGCNDFGNDSTYCRTSGGDLTLALQYQLPRWFGPLALALRAASKIPMYANDNDAPFERPAPGDAQLDFTFWLSGGMSFGSLPLYAFAEVGYRHRTEVFIGDTPDRAFLDGVTVGAQVGYTLFGRLLLGVTLGGVIPVQTNDVTKGYVTLGPFVYLRLFRGLALEASFDPMLYAHASVQGFGTSFGLSYTY